MGRRGAEDRERRSLDRCRQFGRRSCALELAVAAPERIAALVLIGTKAERRPDPAQHASVLQTLRESGLEEAWNGMWAPLFSRSASAKVIADARLIMLRQSPQDLARGVTVFHTRLSRGQLLSTLHCPVIVVTGADDVAPGPRVSKAQADAAQHGQLHVLPDCGHYVPLERPEVLNSILRELIDALR